VKIPRVEGGESERSTLVRGLYLILFRRRRRARSKAVNRPKHLSDLSDSLPLPKIDQQIFNVLLFTRYMTMISLKILHDFYKVSPNVSFVLHYTPARNGRYNKEPERDRQGQAQ
jgi:hypothetical protein